MSATGKLNNALRQEIFAMTPDRLDDLLARLDDPIEVPEETTVYRRRPRQVRRLVAAVLALVLLGTAVFCGVLGARRSVVVIDANAPVAFTVDGFNRVRSVRLADTRAAYIVNAERCTGKSLDDAVQDIAEQMIAADFLTPTDNVILVSVLEDGSRRADKLADKAREGLSAAAAAHEIAPAVVMQTLPETRTAASEAGKAALVQKVIGDVADDDAAKLLDASVQDLVFYAAEMNIALADTEMQGDLASDAYCSADDAVAASLAAAGVAPGQVQSSAILGWQDTSLVYIVSLQSDHYLRLFCVSARTGEVLDDYTPDLPVGTPEPPEETDRPEHHQVTPSHPVPSVTPTTPQPSVPTIPPQPAQTDSEARDTFRDFIHFWGDIDDLF